MSIACRQLDKILRKLKANRPHPQDYPHMSPPDDRHKDPEQAVATQMEQQSRQGVLLFARRVWTDKHTNGPFQSCYLPASLKLCSLHLPVIYNHSATAFPPIKWMPPLPDFLSEHLGKHKAPCSLIWISVFLVFFTTFLAEYFLATKNIGGKCHTKTDHISFFVVRSLWSSLYNPLI